MTTDEKRKAVEELTVKMCGDPSAENILTLRDCCLVALDDIDQARDICQEVIDRVIGGEVHSVHTLGRCKAFINGTPDPGRKSPKDTTND